MASAARVAGVRATLDLGSLASRHVPPGATTLRARNDSSACTLTPEKIQLSDVRNELSRRFGPAFKNACDLIRCILGYNPLVNDNVLYRSLLGSARLQQVSGVFGREAGYTTGALNSKSFPPAVFGARIGDLPTSGPSSGSPPQRRKPAVVLLGTQRR